MTAREDEPQAVVFDTAVVASVAGVVVGRVGPGDHGYLLQLRGTGRGAPQPIERAVARGRRQPGARSARDAVARPALERPGEGILRTLLGEVPVAGHPDQGRNDTTPLRAERGDDRGLDVTRVGGFAHISQTGRTSIEPVLAPGIFAATSIASSRSLASIR